MANMSGFPGNVCLWSRPARKGFGVFTKRPDVSRHVVNTMSLWKRQNVVSGNKVLKICLSSCVGISELMKTMTETRFYSVLRHNLGVEKEILCNETSEKILGQE